MHDDSGLVAGLARGDARAAERFVSEYLPRVRWVLRTFGVRDADLDDVRQDVFMEALRQIGAGRFRGDSELFSWLYHIVKGRAVDHLRKAVNRHAGSVVDLESVSAPDERHLATSADQEALAMAEEALAAMPVRLQLVLRLHYRDGMPVADLARRLTLSEKRVRALMTEAKKRFRGLVLGHEKTATRKRLTYQNVRTRRPRQLLESAAE